jgi:hypothetical protein
MSQICTAYFYLDMDQQPDLMKLVDVMQGCNFYYIGSGYDFILDGDEFREVENNYSAWSVDELHALGDNAILTTQMWEGKEDSSFSINFLKHGVGWITMFQCSDHDLDRIGKHFNGTGKNIVSFFIDIYLVLSAKNIIVANEFGLNIGEYLKFVDAGFSMNKKISDSIIAALGLSEQFNKNLLNQGFEVLKFNGLDFYAQWPVWISKKS